MRASSLYSAALSILHGRQQLEALLRNCIANESNIIMGVFQHSYRRIAGLISNEKRKPRLSVRRRRCDNEKKQDPLWLKWITREPTLCACNR